MGTAGAPRTGEPGFPVIFTEPEIRFAVLHLSFYKDKMFSKTKRKTNFSLQFIFVEIIKYVSIHDIGRLYLALDKTLREDLCEALKSRDICFPKCITKTRQCVRWIAERQMTLHTLCSTEWGLTSHLAKVRGLKILHIFDSGSMNNGHLQHLRGLTQIDMLAINSEHINYHGLHVLRGLQGLTRLSLESEEKMTDAWMKHISTLKHLRSLFLKSPHLTDKSLELLKPLAHLEQLFMSSSKITNLGLVHLRHQKHLHDLVLDSRLMPVINEDGLRHVRALRHFLLLDFDFAWFDNGELVLPKYTNEFCGKFVDGKLHGQGVERYADGTVHKGNFQSGLLHGRGYSRWSTGESFSGNYMEGFMHGKGKFLYADCVSYYDGEWFMDEMHGEGSWHDAEFGETYTGTWHLGEYHGHGFITFCDKSVYCGKWEHDLRCGYGKMVYSDLSKYEGEWRDDQRWGEGKETFPNGQIYLGGWSADKRHGEGMETFPGGLSILCTWNMGERCNDGYSDVDLELIDGNWYYGELLDGVPHGRGTMTYLTGSFVGNWVHGKRCGEGAEVLDGEFRMGQWRD